MGSVVGWSTVFPTAKGPQEAKALAARPTGGRSKKRAPSKKRGKPPCKYGPRDADGYCPPKPPSTARAAGLISSAPGRKISSARSGSGIGEKLVLGSGKQAVQTVVQRLVPRITPRQTKKLAAAKTRALVGEVKKLVASGAIRASGFLKGAKVVGGAAATISGGTIAALAAAGAASYLGTTAILNAIKDRKERKQQAAFERAQAYRQSRLGAERVKGAPLSASEQLALSRAFKAQTGG